MPAVGLEPTRCCQQQILSLPRLPFRHTGEILVICDEIYISILPLKWQVVFLKLFAKFQQITITKIESSQRYPYNQMLQNNPLGFQLFESASHCRPLSIVVLQISICRCNYSP